MEAMRRRLLPFMALRRAAPEPRPRCRCRFLLSPSLLDAVAASATPSPNLLSRSPGSLPPKIARDVVSDGAPRPRGAGWSPEQLSRQLGRWLPTAWTLLRSAAALRAVWVHWRSSSEGPHAMVLVLVGANVAVYALCRLAGPWFWVHNFMTSLDNFKSGRLHTLLTSAFSHRDVNHLLDNMKNLYFFGSSIASKFGPAFLLKLYLAGALTGSAVFLADMAFLAPRKQGIGGWKTHMHGASGAVNAIMLLKIFLYPRELLYLEYAVPVPAAFFGAHLIGADLWMIKKGRSRGAGSTHLGGALVAALVCAKLKGWI